MTYYMLFLKDPLTNNPDWFVFNRPFVFLLEVPIIHTWVSVKIYDVP